MSPNQQPEVSAEAREAAHALDAGSSISFVKSSAIIIQRAINRATEKLRFLWKLASDNAIAANAHRESVEGMRQLACQERDQFRTQLLALEKQRSDESMMIKMDVDEFDALEAKAKRANQLRAELTAQKQCTEAEHRSFEIAREQVEKADMELARLRANFESNQASLIEMGVKLRAELEACEKREADLLYQGENDYTRLDQIADHLDVPYSPVERKAGHSGGAPVRHAIAALRVWQDTEATLRAENEALRKDRERLDWLVKQGRKGDIHWWVEFPIPYFLNERASIDAAMAKGEAT